LQFTCSHEQAIKYLMLLPLPPLLLLLLLLLLLCPADAANSPPTSLAVKFSG
jgi:hypothetical protein